MVGCVEGICRARVIGLVLIARTAIEQAPSVGPRVFEVSSHFTEKEKKRPYSQQLNSFSLEIDQHVCLNLRYYIYIYICVCVCVYIYIYIRICAYVHTCVKRFH